MARPSIFTPEQDTRILEEAERAQKEDIVLDAVYAKLSEEWGLEPKSIDNRHKRLLRDRGMVSSRGLTEGERLAMRLKAIVRDNANASKRADEWKKKYQDEKAEHKALQKEHEKLQAAYQLLMATVSEALGGNKDGTLTQ